MTGGLAAGLSVEGLRTAIDEQTSHTSLGPRITDRALQLAPSIRAYQAEMEWGNEIVSVRLIFDDEWKISDLNFTPRQSLPVDPAGDYESDVSFRDPFEGLWFVVSGSDVEAQNQHVVAPCQRHALDLTVWKDGVAFRGDGATNEDYWSYGQKVIAER